MAKMSSSSIVAMPVPIMVCMSPAVVMVTTRTKANGITFTIFDPPVDSKMLSVMPWSSTTLRRSITTRRLARKSRLSTSHAISPMRRKPRCSVPVSASVSPKSSSSSSAASGNASSTSSGSCAHAVVMQHTISQKQRNSVSAPFTVSPPTVPTRREKGGSTPKWRQNRPPSPQCPTALLVLHRGKVPLLCG